MISVLLNHNYDFIYDILIILPNNTLYISIFPSVPTIINIEHACDVLEYNTTRGNDSRTMRKRLFCQPISLTTAE